MSAAPRRAAARIAAVLITALLALAVLEGIVRAGVTLEPSPAAYSDYLPFTLPPNLHQRFEDQAGHGYGVDTDAEGYRRAPSAGSDHPSAPRVLILGDSFTFGLGVGNG